MASDSYSNRLGGDALRFKHVVVNDVIVTFLEQNAKPVVDETAVV